MCDFDEYDEHAELIRRYDSLSSIEKITANADAIFVLVKLVNSERISAEELGDLLKAINPRYDNIPSIVRRLRLMSAFDFAGIPKPVGRPQDKRVTRRDITTGKVSGERLEAALRAYWKGRKTNNAEMGRVIACLEHEGYINRPGKVGTIAAIKYFTGIVRRKTQPWAIKSVLRGYNAADGLNDDDFKKVLKKCDKIMSAL